jgi:vacuolar-type H+-ATPase subunit D/Vma8
MIGCNTSPNLEYFTALVTLTRMEGLSNRVLGMEARLANIEERLLWLQMYIQGTQILVNIMSFLPLPKPIAEVAAP